MSKDKKYTWKTSGRNGRYINKDIPGKKYKSLKYKYKQITTAGVGIILGKSLALNNYCYIDSVEDLYKAKHKIKYDREEIDRMYKILSHRYGEIISKELAFRRMKEKSSMLNSVMKSLSNQTKFSFTHIKLDAPEKAYLYAMIYPSIFEVNYMYSKDFMYERNPMFLKLCCEMLEEAILLDGFMKAAYDLTFDILSHPRFEVLYYADEEKKTLEIDIEDIPDEEIIEPEIENSSVSKKKGKKQSRNSEDYKRKLIAFFKANAEFIKDVIIERNKAEGKNEIKKEFQKSAEYIMKYSYFMAGSKGEKIFRYMNDFIPTIFVDVFRNIKSKSGILFALYALNRSSHIFDFVYNYTYANVDYHMTDGFVTNYVLWWIANSQIRLLNSLGTNELKKWNKRYEINYKCPESSGLVINTVLTDYDLCFLKSLISRVAEGYKRYDLNPKENRAHYLFNAIMSIESPMVDRFYNFAENLHEQNGDILDEILNQSSAYSYYVKIYDDFLTW